MSTPPIHPLNYATPDLNPRRLRWRIVALLAIAVPFMISSSIVFQRLRASSHRVVCASGLRQIGIPMNLSDPACDPLRRYEQVQSVADLRQVGQAIRLYTGLHAGCYPDTIGPLLLGEDIAPGEPICPASKPYASTLPTVAAQPEEIGSDACHRYVYLGSGLVAPVPADQVIAFQTLADDQMRMKVLFGDGRVELISFNDGMQVINQIIGQDPLVRYPSFPMKIVTKQ